MTDITTTDRTNTRFLQRLLLSVIMDISAISQPQDVSTTETTDTITNEESWLSHQGSSMALLSNVASNYTVNEGYEIMNETTNTSTSSSIWHSDSWFSHQSSNDVKL